MWAFRFGHVEKLVYDLRHARLANDNNGVVFNLDMTIDPDDAEDKFQIQSRLAAILAMTIPADSGRNCGGATSVFVTGFSDQAEE